MPLLVVDKASKKIQDRYTVNAASFTQEPLEKIAIAGETGSGKSTLMKMIGGHEQISEGSIQFNGRDILGPLDKLIPGHPGIAYLGQHFELRNNYFVHELLDYGNKLPATEAQKIYEVCRISHLLQRKNNELSGGERQRIALAKQLVTLPRLLLLDEPFSNLDGAHRHIIRQVVDDIGQRLQTSCIIIAHDPVDILSWAEKVIVMHQGKIIQQASPQEVYFRPVNEYCAGLFGAYNLFSPMLSGWVADKAGIDTKGKRLMVRPEHLQITEPGEGLMEGVVTHTLFYGAGYQVQAEVQGERVKVHHRSNAFQPGDTIGIAFSPNSWSLLENE